MEIFYYFLLTLLIELPIVVAFYRKQWKKALVIGLLLNAFTWPLLQLVLTQIDRQWIPLLEIAIALIEGIGFYIFLRGKITAALLISFIANGISYAAGFLID